QTPITKDPAERKRLALEAAVLAKNAYSILTAVSMYPVVAVNTKIGELKNRVRNTYMDAIVYEGTTHAK
ncbi:MAG: hypothetical protein Q7O66_19585, partial [Dehalococcoidia bacterium]|nr:hypothetical protein [Dehalococcoidia bacterium]